MRGLLEFINGQYIKAINDLNNSLEPDRKKEANKNYYLAPSNYNLKYDSAINTLQLLLVNLIKKKGILIYQRHFIFRGLSNLS